MAEILIETDQRDLRPSECKKQIMDYLSVRETAQIIQILSRTSCMKFGVDSEIDRSDYFGFSINAIDLIDYDSSLAYLTFNFPNILLPIFEESVVEAQSIVMKTRSAPGLRAKRKVHVHIHSLPPIYEFCRTSIGQIRSLSDASSLLQVSGTVVRSGAVRLLEKAKTYQCMNPKCMFRFKVHADPEQGNVLPTPKCCPRKTGNGSSSDASEKVIKCTSTNVREVEGEREVLDYQEIKIQDCAERLPLGSVPRSLIVILEADLVDLFNPGDDVLVVGTMLRLWRPLCKGARCEVDIALLANSVKVLNARDRLSSLTMESQKVFTLYWDLHRKDGKELLARNKIVRAVCPQLYGLYGVKLALLLTLIGGSDPAKRSRITDDFNADNFSPSEDVDEIPKGTQLSPAMRTRCQSHLLIVGDPGTGKSQLLRFATAVIPRSVITTGIGTTGSGLTCTAVKEGNDWCIEAGALVLANEGVCCIDEFASIKEHDRATIHEAMEQQTLSVAKAGLVVKLNTKTTVIAACNPKGNYDISSDITANTAIASPLLSRFDLVLLLLDQPDKEYDKRISTFLLKQATNAGKRVVDASLEFQNSDLVWDIDSIRQYISFVREKFQPTLSPEAAALVQRFYQMQRQSDDRSSSRTTVRLLESLVRLTCAHAKLMSRNIAMLQDAVVAVACVASSQAQLQGHVSLSSSSGSLSSFGFGAPNTSTGTASSFLHYDFPVDPDEDYYAMESKVLSYLHCTKDSLVQNKPEGDKVDVFTSDHVKSSTIFSFPGNDDTFTQNMAPGLSYKRQFSNFEDNSSLGFSDKKKSSSFERHPVQGIEISSPTFPSFLRTGQYENIAGGCNLHPNHCSVNIYDSSLEKIASPPLDHVPVDSIYNSTIASRNFNDINIKFGVTGNEQTRRGSTMIIEDDW